MVISMRSEERLKKSYEKQKDIFEEAKKRKIQNLTKRSVEISQKIKSLQEQLTETEVQLKKEQERNFHSFQDFLSRASEQSQSKRDQRN